MSPPTVPSGLDFDIDSLPLDVFELVDSGLTVESLTGGHAMTEIGASRTCTPGANPCSGYTYCGTYCGGGGGGGCSGPYRPT